MCSTVEYKMWSTMDKVDRSYPLLTATSDKISHGSKTSRKQPLVKDKSPRSDISYLAQHRKYRENQIALSKQAARLKVKSSSDVTTNPHPDSRFKKLSKIDRKPKKTRKDSNRFVPGKLQREKTFCVYTASTGPADFERPTNMPRRPIQDDEPEFLDRGYVSDRPCSIGEKRASDEQRSARPKSAGQALYAVDSDDDSSLGGEIEILDIDDEGETFIVADDNCWDVKPTRQAVDNQPMTRHHDIPDDTNRYHGSQHNIPEQTEHLNVRDSSRYSPVDFINQPPHILAPVTHERRRVKSDSSMVPQRKSASEKWRNSDIVNRESETNWQRKNSYPANSKYGGALKDGGIYTENKYARAMEKVLNKYTHLTLGEKSGAPPRGPHVGPKSQVYGPRNSLPRKLKPLVNRDKLGQVSEKY